MATASKCTPVCASGQAARAASSGPRASPKLALPKQLAAAAGGLLGLAPAAAVASVSEQVPFGASPAPAAAASVTSAVTAVDVPDVSGLLGGLDPLVVGGGLAALAIPAAIVALAGGGSKAPKAKAVTVSVALEALAADEELVLLDIRSKSEVKAEGSPSLKGISKRAVVAVPYTSVDKDDEVSVVEEWADKVAAIKTLTEETPLILIDSAGEESLTAANKLLASTTFTKLYYIQGGAEAWREAEAPWREPPKLPTLPTITIPDLSSLNLEGPLGSVVSGVNTGVTTIAGGVKVLADEYNESPTLAKGLLTAGALVGASVLLFSQAEILFELAGVVAAGQFLFKLVDGKERKQTLAQLSTLVNEKVAVAEVGQDLGKIATTLLLDDTTGTTSKSVRPAPEAAEAAAAAAAEAAAAEAATARLRELAAAAAAKAAEAEAAAAAAANGNGSSGEAAAAAVPAAAAEADSEASAMVAEVVAEAMAEAEAEAPAAPAPAPAAEELVQANQAKQN